MQSRNVQSNRRGLVIAACVIGALIAQTASADCPPGYRSKAGHCIPGPMQTHHPVAIESSVHAPTAVSPIHANKPRTYAHATAVTPVHATTTHHYRSETAYASHSTHSGGPAPAASASGYDLRAQHEAKTAHGIIFVGGKQALNPQPIPPGHVKAAIPHPGAPIEKSGTGNRDGEPK
ncbi:MAG TPA: hypothetical protein VJ727_09115 [Rhodanobacteraceae bacterium]|nr:hypothetical protein [Rhodanobacteraceae bacterium]